MKNKLSVLIVFSIVTFLYLISIIYAQDGLDSGFDIYTESESYSLCSCGISSYNLFVQNTDVYEKSFLVKIEGDASGFVSIGENLFLLKPGEKKAVEIIVAMPCSFNKNTKFNILVESDGEKKRIEQDITLKKCSNYDVYTDHNSLTTAACVPAVYNITFVNTKDFIDYVDLHVDDGNNHEQDIVVLSENPIILLPNQQKKVSLNVVPQCSESEDKEIILTAKSRNTGVVKKLAFYLNIIEEEHDYNISEDEAPFEISKSNREESAKNLSLVKLLIMPLLVLVSLLGLVELAVLLRSDAKKESNTKKTDLEKKQDDVKIKQIDVHKLFKKETDSEKKHSKKKLWIIVPLLIILFVFLILGGIYTITNPSEDINATINKTLNQTDLVNHDDDVEDDVKVEDDNLDVAEFGEDDLEKSGEKDNVSVYDKYENYNFGKYSRDFIIKEMNKNSYRLFNLNKLFFDADSDKLSYAYETSDNFTVSINGGFAFVKPDKDYVGDGFITFKADDNKGGAAESPRFILIVNNEEPKNVNFTVILVVALFLLSLAVLCFREKSRYKSN